MYVVHSDVIEKNVNDIRKAFRDNGVCLELHYSYKTNAMKEVLEIMNRLNVLPEVVSEEEFNSLFLQKLIGSEETAAE